jgi:Ca2+-binding EF-hand superfamily protein
MRYGLLTISLTALLVSACSGDTTRPLPGEGAHRPRGANPAEAFLRFDSNHDGEVTEAEMNAGVRAEFAVADVNHDGVLDLAEMRVVNARRLESDGTGATPLIDWNQDGHVDFQEFAAAPRSLFKQTDRNNDGTLTPDEINPHPRQHHKPPPMIAPYGNHL